MLNILFWNVYKKPLQEIIVECILENEIDIAVFTEAENVNFSLIEDELINYSVVEKKDEKSKLYYFAKKSLDAQIIQEQDRYTFCKFNYALCDYILCGIHLEDMRNSSSDDRCDTIRKLLGNLEQIEDSYNIVNSIVVGDVNANPYDKEIISIYGFNAVLFKKLIEHSEYIDKRYENRKRFYNPILHFISESTEMYGSYYSSQGSNTPYWNCLDQVLVRKSLVNKIKNVQYLKKISATGLMNRVEINKNISDHLPLLVQFSEVEDAV